MEEEWRAIPGFSNYEASTFGNIRHKKYKRNRKYTLKNTYYRLSLPSDDGKKNSQSVHTLVAKAFLLKSSDEDNSVDHLNSISTDNRVSNLRWLPLARNRHHKLKITLELVTYISQLVKSKKTPQEILDIVTDKSGIAGMPFLI